MKTDERKIAPHTFGSRELPELKLEREKMDREIKRVILMIFLVSDGSKLYKLTARINYMFASISPPPFFFPPRGGGKFRKEDSCPFSQFLRRWRRESFSHCEKFKILSWRRHLYKFAWRTLLVFFRFARSAEIKMFFTAWRVCIFAWRRFWRELISCLKRFLKHQKITLSLFSFFCKVLGYVIKTPLNLSCCET